MPHEPFEDMVPLYAVGALDRQERQVLESHLLTGCGACHNDLRQYQAAVGLLPFQMPVVPAPAELKSRLKAALAPDPSQHSTHSSASAPKTAPLHEGIRLHGPKPSWIARYGSPMLTFLSFIVLGGALFYGWTVRSQVTSELAQRQDLEGALRKETARLAALQQQVNEQERLLAGLRLEFGQRTENMSELRDTLITHEVELEQTRLLLTKREQEVAGLKRNLVERDEMLQFLRSPRVEAIRLNPAEGSRLAGGLILYDPETRKALFYAYNLPPLPEGRSYYLWAFVGRPTPLGIFTTDAGGKSRLIIRTMPHPSVISKLAVSEEASEGSQEPTGTLALVADL